jgi:hypothetical protein
VPPVPWKVLSASTGKITEKLNASRPTSAIIVSGSQSCCRLRAYFRPSRTPPLALRFFAPAFSGRMAISATMTAT